MKIESTDTAERWTAASATVWTWRNRHEMQMDYNVFILIKTIYVYLTSLRHFPELNRIGRNLVPANAFYPAKTDLIVCSLQLLWLNNKKKSTQIILSPPINVFFLPKLSSSQKKWKSFSFDWFISIYWYKYIENFYIFQRIIIQLK